MNWRDTLIGSGITLFITVLAGLLVYYFTKEPLPAAPHEHIIYSVETSASFGTDPDAISFFTVSVKNTGTQAAHNVTIFYRFPLGYTIQDKRVTSPSGITTTMTDKSSDNNINIIFPILVPDEESTISLLVKGPYGLKPDVRVRSDESIGIAAPLPSNKIETTTSDDNKNKKLPLVLGVLVVAGALVLQVVIVGFLLPRLRGMGIIPAGYGSQADRLNNTGFVWLQEGLPDEAQKLLYTAISIHGGEPLSIANYGLALGLQGDAEGARKHFEIATWWARSRHERAVISYNQAILLIKEKRPMSEIIERLGDAFAGSRKQITRYCELNVVIREETQRSPELRSFIEQRGRVTTAR